MNKLEQGAESFKEFVIDEYNQLFEQYKKMEDSNTFMRKKHTELQDKHQNLTALYLKLIDANDSLSKHVKTFGNLSKIELQEKQLFAYAASHADLCKKDNEMRKLIEFKNECLNKKTNENYNICLQNEQLMEQIDELKNLNTSTCKRNHGLYNLTKELRSENDELRKFNISLSKSNTKHIDINAELINLLELLGYGVGANSNLSATGFLKHLLNRKYHVEEVKEPAKDNEDKKKDFNTDSLKDLLVKGLGKNYHVEVIGGDEVSKRVMKDLFSNPDINSSPNAKRFSKPDVKSDSRSSKVSDGVKASPKRDANGRFIK